MNNSSFEISNVNQYICKHRNEFNKEIGGVIKQIRIRKNISLQEMAARTLMSPTYVNQIENGINGISLNKFVQICNSLKVHSKEILDDFLFYRKVDEDLFFEELQCQKNLSDNILEFMKKKKIVCN